MVSIIPIPASSLRESSVSADLSRFKGGSNWRIFYPQMLLQFWSFSWGKIHGKIPWDRYRVLDGTGSRAASRVLAAHSVPWRFGATRMGRELYPMIKLGGKWSNLDEFRRILYKGKISKNNGKGKLLKLSIKHGSESKIMCIDPFQWNASLAFHCYLWRPFSGNANASTSKRDPTCWSSWEFYVFFSNNQVFGEHLSESTFYL